MQRPRFAILFVIISFSLPVKSQVTGSSKATSGNPVIKGWYADPGAAIFNKKYWIYPTYSAPYEEQVFMDAFSSTDLELGNT